MKMTRSLAVRLGVDDHAKLRDLALATSLSVADVLRGLIRTAYPRDIPTHEFRPGRAAEPAALRRRRS